MEGMLYEPDRLNQDRQMPFDLSFAASWQQGD
jgi:hypothetical protein